MHETLFARGVCLKERERTKERTKEREKEKEPTTAAKRTSLRFLYL